MDECGGQRVAPEVAHGARERTDPGGVAGAGGVPVNGG
jgi:hypothetical protein